MKEIDSYSRFIDDIILVEILRSGFGNWIISPN
jgi:hypothetical protein